MRRFQIDSCDQSSVLIFIGSTDLILNGSMMVLCFIGCENICEIDFRVRNVL
jgi:hypothetical protein